MKSIYIAAPFSHKSKRVRNKRFKEVNIYSACLMQKGYIVFSPLSHSVPISKYLNNPNDTDFYINQDLYWLKYCSEIHVLMLSGWAESKGLKRELEFAVKNNIKIKYVLAKNKNIKGGANANTSK